ncbi:hypothetical protein [Nostoc sp. 'Peltigera membranacea cyanobiont' 232]|uniref:hypothetical protein n=1 Tax=Nostoc sp. 'Peltigera membranacea cyanobiont' 232 TaxID=2014531 RepID=UPI000B954571|nr:hypothetical protein [Nostoc sp. 'Peltigera membranacea cyanobiont' 232]OYE01042.1 hypothetical protein CDG79_31775 [Nostoc sp. 'Peltigera membranacea cyanobiont' 232]
MATHNPKFYTIDTDGNIILHSKHVNEIVDVHINKEKRRFSGVKKDGDLIEYDCDFGSDFAQPVMLYKIYYCFKNDTWGVGYRIKGSKEKKWLDGFKTAREAWLYRQVLIAGGFAEKDTVYLTIEEFNNLR